MLSLKGFLSNRKVSNKLLIALSTVILTSIVQASPSSSLGATNLITMADASSDSSPEAMLTPGAKLIAGDPNKNEFFIIGTDDKEPVRPINIEKPQIKPEVIEMTTNDVQPDEQETVTKVGNALHHTMPTSKKSEAAILTKVAKAEKKHVKTVAKKQNKHVLPAKVANKKQMHSKMVAMKKPVHTKIVNKKMNSKIKMALNGKTHHKVIELGKSHPYMG